MNYKNLIENYWMLLASILFVIGLIYGSLTSSLIQSTEQLQKKLTKLESDIVFVQEKTFLFKTLQQKKIEQVQSAESLLKILDNTSRQIGLRSYIEKIQPIDGTHNQVYFQKVPMVLLLKWFSSLISMGVRVHKMSLSKHEESGFSFGEIEFEKIL